MQTTAAHRALVEKFMFKQSWKDVIIPDTLVEIVTMAYTEEEADLVTKLGFRPLAAEKIARKIGRPAGEVEPILRSLSDRGLIAGMKVKGKMQYGFLGFAPGVFEAQMLQAKTRGGDMEYYRKFAKLFDDWHKEFTEWLAPRIKDKDLRFGRIIPVEKSLDSAGGVMPLATDRYSEIVDRNKSFSLVEVCACRYQQELVTGKNCGKPMDVCSAMGILADFVVYKGWGRRVSKEEFIDAKNRATEAGLVHMTDNLHDPLQVCSCCTCCCGVMTVVKNYNLPSVIARSHFEASVDAEACEGCGDCVEWCPMDAVSLDGEKASIDFKRCIGCGVCITKCDHSAMSLKERKGHKPPSENAFDFYADRYLEVKGPGIDFVPRLKLGFARFVGKVLPIQPSGPKYKPLK